MPTLLDYTHDAVTADLQKAEHIVGEEDPAVLSFLEQCGAERVIGSWYEAEAPFSYVRYLGYVGMYFWSFVVDDKQIIIPDFIRELSPHLRYQHAFNKAVKMLEEDTNG